MNRPIDSEYANYFRGYIDQVSETDVMAVLRSELDDLDVLLDRVPADKETYAYDAGKWTIRQVVGHLIDGERVFGYRALCIARGETQNLPGFEQDDYLQTSPYNHMDLEDLLSELRLVRLSNIAMFRSLDGAAWDRVGTANNNQVSVRALAFIMAGHLRHHMNVLREKYLNYDSPQASLSA